MQKSSNPLIKNATELQYDISQREFFELQNGDVSMFVGKIEIKPKESVVMTLDAPQGAGKTRSMFQFVRTFAESGYRCLIVSLEEHPDSLLFTEKVEQYLPKSTRKMVDTVGELPNGLSTLIELSQNYDYIVIDSWQKVHDGKGRLDELRKSLDGKFISVIFQRTTDNKMRGGSTSQFDADMVCKAVKDESNFENNYLYWDKNRYNPNPFAFFISSGECLELPTELDN